MPRILHVLKRFRPDFSGRGIEFERLSSVMDALRPDVTHEMLATHTAPPAQPRPAANTLYPIYYLGGDNAFLAPELRIVLWMLRNGHRFDVVHFHTLADRYFLGALIARLLGKRVILSATLDDSLPTILESYRRRWRGLVIGCLRLFHRFQVLNETLAAENERVLPGRSVVIPVGIPTAERSDEVRSRSREALGLAQTGPVLLFVGGLCARKDPLCLIRAMPAILAHRADATLLLVGPDLEPDYTARLRAEAEALGVAESVRLEGRTDSPYRYFEAADLFVFASRMEGFGAVTAEAMAHRLPVVVRSLPGVTDTFVRPGQTAIVFEQDAELAEKVLAVLDDPAMARRMGDEAAAQVERDFGMARVASAYLHLYGFPAPPPNPEIAEADRRVSFSLLAKASLCLPVFQDLLVLPTDLPPLLVVLVDAEEEFDWAGGFDPRNRSVRAMRAIGNAHAVLDRYSVIPTYLTDYAVADQPDGYRPLIELMADGRCEIGSQLHPWVNPPLLERPSPENSFTGNLPLALQIAKLEALTRRIEDNLGVRPYAYRAGRFGFGSRTADSLIRLGYRVDTSLMPWFQYRAEGGPSHLGVPTDPIWADRDHRLMVLPATSAWIGPASGIAERMTAAITGRMATRLRLQGVLAGLGLANRVKLTPEGIRLSEAKTLVRQELSRGRRVFCLSYHSPSLVPGNTPYVPDKHALEEFMAWLDGFLDFFTSEIGGRPIALREFLEMADGGPTVGGLPYSASPTPHVRLDVR